MISVGLIGCGAIAESGHLPMILHHGRFRLAAVCDVDLRRAQLLSQQAGGVAAYQNWRELLAFEKLDAVVLALPPEVSSDIVIECLHLGLAVLDEKPLAATVAQGRRLAHAVSDLGGIYQIGFVLRYGDWVQEIRRLALSFDSPLAIHVEVYDEQYDPTDIAHFGRIQSFLANSSAMTHEGSHVVDYVSLWNSSNWTRVRASAKQTSPTFAGPNVWNAKIDFADDSTLDLKVGWLLPELPPSTIRINGPAGQLEFNYVTGKGWCRIGSDSTPLAIKPLAPEWERQYDVFADTIEKAHKNIATVYDGLRALEVTAACEASAQTGCTVTPADIDTHPGSFRFDSHHGTAARKRPIVGPSDRKILGGPIPER